MSKKYLVYLLAATTIIAGTAAVQAYPSEAMFGGGYSGVRHIQNQAQYSDAINDYSSVINKSAKETTEQASEEAEKNVSNIRGRNGKYDYNPYTGHDAGVNDTKSIYTDDLGRLHFFGKANRFKESN